MASKTATILTTIIQGDRSAIDQLMELTYDDFRRLAKSYLGNEAGQTLQPTAIVHEVFIKLVKNEDVDWRGRSHFFAVGATAMRQILVDHARSKMTEKRGGGRTRVALDDERLVVSIERDEDVLALDELLDRLSHINESRAKIVEMRFFGGMTLEEVATVLNVSVSTVKRQWAVTSSWLRAELLKSSNP
ncbi:MAG: sigma-70 family RNA polymerase sigma factor [Planctomycetota bacterium]